MFDVGIASFGKAFLPGHATGGRPSVNKPSIVGERGPELFVPDRYGSVIPNGRLAFAGAGTGDLNVQIVNYSREQISQERTIEPDGSQNLKLTIGQMMANEVRTGGPFMREMRNAKSQGRF